MLIIPFQNAIMISFEFSGLDYGHEQPCTCILAQPGHFRHHVCSCLVHLLRIPWYSLNCWRFGCGDDQAIIRCCSASLRVRAMYVKVRNMKVRKIYHAMPASILMASLNLISIVVAPLPSPGPWEYPCVVCALFNRKDVESNGNMMYNNK